VKRHRRKKTRQFSQPESERLVRFTRLFGMAYGVFKAMPPSETTDSILAYRLVAPKWA
ncbi:MAG: hypothetical protein ACJAVK_003097, partial [Akkermansiaceae bacterium]